MVATHMTLDRVVRRHYNRAARIAFVALPDAFRVGVQKSGTLTKGGPGNGDRSASPKL
jgi:hypothetical protein